MLRSSQKRSPSLRYPSYPSATVYQTNLLCTTGLGFSRSQCLLVDPEALQSGLGQSFLKFGVASIMKIARSEFSSELFALASPAFQAPEKNQGVSEYGLKSDWENRGAVIPS